MNCTPLIYKINISFHCTHVLKANYFFGNSFLLHVMCKPDSLFLQVLVNSSVNSLSCVNAASATVFTSGSTASSQSPAAPPQSTVQPVILSPHPVTRPGNPKCAKQTV
ncbi:UNVERIFIED_CONTAM: hypothetical protein FKN15_049187 [Acipenser sinensis]